MPPTSPRPPRCREPVDASQECRKDDRDSQCRHGVAQSHLEEAEDDDDDDPERDMRTRERVLSALIGGSNR